MIRILRTLLISTALAGFFPQMGAAATACRSGVMSAQTSAHEGDIEMMAGMSATSARSADKADTGLPCNTSTTSHQCSQMAPCSIACIDGLAPTACVDGLLAESPASSIMSQPSSHTSLPEPPPPRG